jgi:hypothetical protein
MFEIQPVKFGPEFALAASLYLFSNFVVSLSGAGSSDQRSAILVPARAADVAL